MNISKKLFILFFLIFAFHFFSCTSPIIPQNTEQKEEPARDGSEITESQNAQQYCSTPPLTDEYCHPLATRLENSSYQQIADIYTEENFGEWSIPLSKTCKPTPQCCFIYCACPAENPIVLRLIYSRTPYPPRRFIYQWDDSPTRALDLSKATNDLYQTDLFGSFYFGEKHYHRFRFKIIWDNYIVGKEFFLDGKGWAGSRGCGIITVEILVSVPKEHSDIP